MGGSPSEEGGDDPEGEPEGEGVLLQEGGRWAWGVEGGLLGPGSAMEVCCCWCLLVSSRVHQLACINTARLAMYACLYCY